MPDASGFTVVQPVAEFSDDALALRFSDQHGDELLYVPAWGTWQRWDGCRWAHDDTLVVFSRARAVCRTAAAEARLDGREGLPRSLSSAKTVAAVERLARADERHARRAEAFDADPWALNTPAGVVDLRTGRMRAHRKSDLFTKATSVVPDSRVPVVRWLRFLDEACRGDRDMAAYLQRWAGYTLTGDTREHAFLFIVGPGGNGKGVLLGTLAAVLGSYATTAMADVFTVGRNDQHPTHLAALRGARLVAVTETEEGKPWAEARIKALTGGDRITARVMRGDPFEFTPVFKLWITGNHRPVLRNPDPAMRRRLHLVPFTYVPPKPDQGLADALQPELPGILAWCIAGCLEWQQRGLQPPQAVRDATAEYFAEQDALAAWLAERCKRDPAGVAPSRALFVDWKAWALERGQEPGTEVRFSEAMERHASKKRTKTGVVFVGLKLLPGERGAW